MPIPRPVRVMPAAGSINTGASPSLLPDNEYQDLINRYSYAGRLRRRGGSLRRTPEASTHKPTTLYPMVDSLGEWHMVIGAHDAIGIMEAPGYMASYPADPFGIPEDDEPWGIISRDDIAYMYRSNHHIVRRLDVTTGSLTYAGIETPAAPVIADGAAGTIPAASFQGVIVFYNLKTGNHGAYSPVSNTLAHAANKKIVWTWTAPTNGQVTHVGLFRTLPDQTGAYYRVALVPAILTTYEEDTLVAGMGAAAIPNVGPPGSLWYAPAVFKERAWATDGRLVYPSEFLKFETFNQGLGLAVGPDDGAKVVGLKADDDRLYVQKDNGMYYITGSGPSEWQVHDLDPKRGGISHHAIGLRNGTLVWPGADALYISQGAPAEPIKNGVHTRELFKAMDMEQAKNFQAVVSDRDNLYILVPRWAGPNIEDDGEEGPWARRMIVYSFDTGDITTFKMDRQLNGFHPWDVEPTAIGAGRGPDKQPGVWIGVEATSGGTYDILTFNDPDWDLDDIGNPDVPAHLCAFNPAWCGTYHLPIRDYVKTKNFGAEGTPLVGLLRLHLLTSRAPSAGAVLTAIPSDGGPEVERTVNIPITRLWQAYSLSTRKDPSDGVAVSIATADDNSVDIDGFMLDLVDIYRTSRAR